METVGRLAGGVAHEFNNLLAVVLMNTELAMMSLPSNSQTRKYLEAIRRNSDLGARIAGQLLAFSRRQITKPQVINLSSVLLEMDKMLRSLIGENIELQIQPSEDLGRIRMDRSQIEQVLVNLVVNARDAMPHGGKLTIIATNITIDEDHAREYARVVPGEYVMLTVSDTGVGMTEEIRAHLFEPFYTTKEVGKGTGLGLATCYGIVSQNGGNIRADSKPDKGTTFRIYLSRVYEEVEVPFDGAESESLPQGTETVLLVEDEPSVRNVVALALRELGYTVLEAGNGEEGLEVAEKYGGGKIDLLLTDVVMPRMWGKELSERLRTVHPSIRTIFFSGYPGDFVVDYGVLDPDIDFVPKPFSRTVLARRVREVLDNEAPKA
jgi:CheY-like chemotaxis protein